MSTTFKLRNERRGNHVHVDLFAGPTNGTLANCGHLVFTVGEHQIFGAALYHAQNTWQGGALLVTEEDFWVDAKTEEGS